MEEISLVENYTVHIQLGGAITASSASSSSSTASFSLKARDTGSLLALTSKNYTPGRPKGLELTLVETSNYSTIDAGIQDFGAKKLRVVKLLPNEESSDVVISTLYINEKESLIEKAVTTTKENGTYTMIMNYGAYSNYGLPDQVVFEFNTKNYKLPKGITLEFEDESKPLSAAQQLKNKKGRVEINYKNYVVNKGIPAAIFN